MKEVFTRVSCKSGMDKMEEINGVFSHPFTCLIAGPTQSGKSSFVEKLLKNHKSYMGINLEYIFIFLGTSEEENTKLSSLKKHFPKKVQIFNLRELFPEEKMFKTDCPTFIKDLINTKQGANGCLIFDDLMKEMGNCDIALDLFTKYSSHKNISVFYITQNIFYQGKCASLGVTLFKNAHIIVLFMSYFDAATLSHVARKIAPNKKNFKEMLSYITQLYRYVVLRSGFKVPEALRVTSDYFNEDPVVHYKSFSLL